MLTAVWVAVVIAAAAFVIGVGVAVYVMLKAARLMTESSAARASLREREDLLVERAGSVVDRAGAQIAATETITASMADVTASMAELRGRIAALAPARPGTGDSGGALTWVAALIYGLARALGLRWAARYRLIRRRGLSAPEAAPGPSRPAPGSGRQAALPGRRGGASP